MELGVWGVGFRAKGSGFRVRLWGLRFGFGVQSSRFRARVQGSGFTIQKRDSMGRGGAGGGGVGGGGYRHATRDHV